MIYYVFFRHFAQIFEVLERTLAAERMYMHSDVDLDILQ